MDAVRLLATKARLAAHDLSLQPALSRLLWEANEALQAGPFSVMDKMLVPPSGDKHDYMSYGPYWWPDPQKEDGSPYIRRDGEVNPETQVGTDKQALPPMVSAVDTLALAYYLTDAVAYAERAAYLLRVFFLDPATRMNPHLEYGQAIPGRCLGRGVGIIDTRNLPLVVDAIGLLFSFSGWTAQDQNAMVAWFEAYLNWLRTSEHGLDESEAHNNHGTWYDVQVASFALFIGRETLAGQIIEESKGKRIAIQIQPDGSQPFELARTRSLSYSAMNLKGLFTLASLGEKVNIDLWHYEIPDGRSIRKALDFLQPYTDPQQEWPYQQITPFERTALVPLFYQGTRVYQDSRYHKALAKLTGESALTDRIRLLYPD